MLSVNASGDFKKTTKFLEFLESGKMFSVLEHYGRVGVDALSDATPIETGETSISWGYSVNRSGSRYSINWFNENEEDGVNIAVILQYGHGTGTGGYVRGIDYINPAMKPVFTKIIDDVWRQVRNG
jgi:hypothetical protein